MIEILNKLEEFSVKIIYANLTSHESLTCLHAAFTDITERNILIILMQREAITGIKTYNTLLKLYNKWQNKSTLKDDKTRSEDMKKFYIKITEKIHSKK